MKVRRILSLVFAVTMILGVAVSSVSCQKQTKYTVGICQLAPHDALDAATKGFKDQLVKEFGEDISFLEENAQGEAATCTTIISNFTNKKVDLILANATGALQAAANGTETIPVLGTSITEYGTALGIKNFNGTVGTNISGTSDLAPLDQQAAMIKELFPEAKTVGLLYCSSEANSDYQIKIVKEELEKLGYVCENLSFTDSNDVAAVAGRAANNDVIYAPTDNTVANCAGTILGAIGDTPLIAGEKGICGGCGVATLSIDYYDLGVTTGKMAAKILRGEEDVSTMPVAYAEEFSKLYNEARCKELNIDIEALKAAGYTAIAD